MEGVVKEKEAAKAEYREAISKGKQANLLESVRKDIFSLKVGNLRAGGYVKIVLTYVTSLKAQEDAVAFTLPTYIAPRYSPIHDVVTMAQPEAQAMAPPSDSVKWFGLDIKVGFTFQSNIKSIRCPTHDSEPSLLCNFNGKTGQVVLKDIDMDRDVVMLAVEEQCHQPRAVFEVSEDGSKAGFVTLFPQIEFQDLRREFIFIIDRSGSMNGRQIQQAGETLLLFLRALPVSCTFNVVGFGSTFVSLFDMPQPYNDETLQLASAHANSMRADLGGTEIMAPLEHVFRQNHAAVERQVFVLTDGQVSNDLQVFEVIRKYCSKGLKSRLFSIGVGASVSRHLVEGMARAGRGTSRFVGADDAHSLNTKVLGQLKQALQPSLDNVSVEWKFPGKPKGKAPPKVRTLLGYRSPSADIAPPRETKVYPSYIPPLFNREKFTSFAMFAADDPMPESVKVSCDSSDGPLEVILPIKEEDVFHGNIAHKMAASAAISEYEDNQKSRYSYRNHHANGNEKSIGNAEALQLALKHSLVSELTSFIAVLNNPVVEAGAVSTKKVIPQFSSQPSPTLNSSSYKNLLTEKVIPQFSSQPSPTLKSSSYKNLNFRSRGQARSFQSGGFGMMMSQAASPAPASPPEIFKAKQTTSQTETQHLQ